jgi:hypothetical protein
MAAGAVSRIKYTISIHENGHTHAYMQVSMTFQL